jgi:hypothetical protein
VAHDDHSVEGRVRTIGIKDSTRPPQGLPQQVGRVGDRVPARVAHGPELKPCPECRVGLEALRAGQLRDRARQRPWIKTTGTLPRS